MTTIDFTIIVCLILGMGMGIIFTLIWQKQTRDHRKAMGKPTTKR